MNKEKLKINSKLAIDKSKKGLKAVGNSLGETLSNMYQTRVTYKRILDWSTKENLYARGNEVNSPSVKFSSLKWLGIGIVYFFVMKNISILVMIVGLVLLFLLFWFSPRSAVMFYCNRIIASSIDKLDYSTNRNKILMSLVQLMKDLEINNLSGKQTIDRSGFKRIEFDNDGDITLIHFEQDGKVNNLKLRNWNQSEFQMCYVIPRMFDSLSDAHLVLHSKFTVSLSHYALKDWEGFTEYVLQNESIARSFPQIRKHFEEEDAVKRQEEKFIKQQQREKEISDFLKPVIQKIKEDGINGKVGYNIEEIMNKRDEWNVSVYDPVTYLTGNKKYAKMRLKLRNNAQYKDTKKLESTLERALNCDVTVSPISSDKGSVMLLLLYETRLRPFKVYANKLIDRVNSRDSVFLGDSYTAGLTAKMNNQANHMLVTGQSGAGKSVLITNIMVQLANLNKYAIKEMYVGSAAKVADFVLFEDKGAYLTEGTENIVEMLSNVLNIAKERESIFKQTGVRNLEDYNYQAKPSEQINRVLVVVDEYETALMTGDRVKLERLMLSILNIGRSSGIMVMIGSQSTMKQHIGSLKDKVQNKFIGYMDRQTSVDAREQELGDYFASLDGDVQGTFFYESSNMRPEKEFVKYKDTDRILLQTPYVQDIKDNIPSLKHQEVSLKYEDDSEESIKMLF